ncbi:MAG: Crp/Fnr family transcriptional regulator [Sulfurimicrobium sp.]|nr:Crp/Fnr family transcriptional regulator [Sulfurimicrobium sp.]MDZ7657337.1 Crp/Fnr family transcriptional regulator [Sulfurimicrobium sp.]
MNEITKEQLLALFPSLRGLPAGLEQRLDRESTYIEAPAGTVLFESNSPCQAFPMLLTGSVRVTRAGANGRELQLYRVAPGESCIITSSCLLGQNAYPARGIAEGSLSAVVLPRALFSQMIEQHPPFRAYIFNLFGERLALLMQLVEEVAFRKLDQRLAALLLARGEVIHATHQNLADELGSVREIISRLLKSFQDQGMLELGREQIRVLDTKALRVIAM